MPFSPRNPHPAAPTTTIASERRDGGSPVLKTLSSSPGLLPFRKALVRIPIIWPPRWFLDPCLVSNTSSIFASTFTTSRYSILTSSTFTTSRTCELRFLVNESSGEWILLVSTLKICFLMNNLIVFIALRYSSHCSQFLKAFHYTFTITAVQFAVGSVLVLFMWGFNLYKRPKISGAQTLELWYFSENKTISILAHDNTVFSLAASNATGLVASASHDKVKLWK